MTDLSNLGLAALILAHAHRAMRDPEDPGDEERLSRLCDEALARGMNPDRLLFAALRSSRGKEN